MSAAVDFQNVDIVFGEEQRRSLEMIDRGASREEILAETGSVLGCADANLTVETGEICVLMGLSGSGKSTLLRAVNRLNVPARGKVLVRDGELLEANMRRDRLTRSELEAEMRLAGIARLDEVRWAILEPQGKISFVGRGADQGASNDERPAG